MNQSTRIMFLIGLICNILEIICLVVGIVGLAIAVGDSAAIFDRLPADVQAQFVDAETFKKYLATGCAGCVLGLLISIAVLICARLANKAQEKGTNPKAWPIVIIVLGALNNIFYLVAGILCLVENTQPAPAKAKNKEETK